MHTTFMYVSSKGENYLTKQQSKKKYTIIYFSGRIDIHNLWRIISAPVCVSFMQCVRGWNIQKWNYRAKTHNSIRELKRASSYLLQNCGCPCNMKIISKSSQKKDERLWKSIHTTNIVTMVRHRDNGRSLNVCIQEACKRKSPISSCPKVSNLWTS